MNSLHRLEEIFTKFPGIGPRQAKRFVYYLLNKPASSIKEFIQLIEEAKKSIRECSLCHQFYIPSSNLNSDTTKSPLCSICSDTSRDKSILMVVARDSDFETIEKSGVYKGLYFILGGTIPILDKQPDKRIRLEALLERILESKFKEIILSLNTTPEGEHTTEIVKEAIEKVQLSAIAQTKISILGRGLSTGAELEYADSETIKNALKNRT